MSVRGVTAQELPENQESDVAGVVINERLHGHSRPAAAIEEREVPVVEDEVEDEAEQEEPAPPVEPPAPVEPPVAPAAPVDLPAAPPAPLSDEVQDAAGAGE